MTDIVFNGLLALMVIYLGKDADCGIPILKWNLVYLLLLTLRSISSLIKLAIIRHFSWYSNYWTLGSYLFVDGSFLIWLIYGNILFYSSRNLCGTLPESQVLYNLMLVLLIIGYFQMLLYGALLCCLPFIIYYFWREQALGGLRRHVPESSIHKVLRSLTRKKFR
jgi:hypothetical protein